MRADDPNPQAYGAANRFTEVVERWSHVVNLQRSIDAVQDCAVQGHAAPDRGLDERLRRSMIYDFDGIFSCPHALEQFQHDVAPIVWASNDDPHGRYQAGSPWPSVERLAYEVLADRQGHARRLAIVSPEVQLLQERAAAVWTPDRPGLAIRYQHAMPHQGLWSSVPTWVPDAQQARNGVTAGYLQGHYRWAVRITDNGCSTDDGQLALVDTTSPAPTFDERYLYGLDAGGGELSAQDAALIMVALQRGRAWPASVVATRPAQRG